MKTTGIVTKHLNELIAKQVDDHGLVVWYDPECVYADAARTLELADATILLYEGSFVQLRWNIDQRKLMEGEHPPRLGIYVPMAHKETQYALIELEAAGVVLQPGQQPPTRNTRLAVLARNALKGLLGDDAAAEVERQTEAGRLTLADLNALAEKGRGISKGVLTLVFGTGNPQEIALAFLNSGDSDAEIRRKEAKGELQELLQSEFDLEASKNATIDGLRRQLGRHALITELIIGLGDAAPSKLTSVRIASTSPSKDACVALARSWRLRHDTRNSYILAAKKAEREFDIAKLELDPAKIEEIETFPAIEQALLGHVEDRLLHAVDGRLLTLAESRLSRFWCDAEPSLQTRWALVASAAQVLLEADRVEQALKKAPSSMIELVNEYAAGSPPWCLLDTYHRQLESRWHNLEHQGDDEHDSTEKLVIKARQRYVQVGSELAQQFVRQVEKERELGRGILLQRQIFEKHVKPSLTKQKAAYVWVDALRFEMARELARLLKEDFEVELHPALASVPTVTEIGMSALLPGAHETAKIVAIGPGKLALEISGVVIKNRKDRVSFLKDRSDVAVFDAKLDDLLPKPSKKVRDGVAAAELVLITSQEIDELCEQDNITQARRQMDGVLNDLRRGIRELVKLGVERVVLTSDHGHLFADELSEDMKVNPPVGETADLHRRVWVGRGGETDEAYLRIPLSALGMESDFDMATPRTFACFKSKGGARAYFHGGLSPQELIIPLVILTPLTEVLVGPPSGIDWKLIPGSEKLTTRFFSVQVAGSNTGLFEVEPPRVRVELRAKGKTISRPVSASYGFDEATGDVALKNDDENPREIAPNTVALMVIEDVDQKSVGLYLLDATTGVELGRLDKIDVSIAI